MRATALLLLQLAAASAQSCANTCFQGSCDYWDGGVWGTCAVLESTYSCDCSGCECDGCPQGTCGVDQPFDPATCLNAGDARCDPAANTEACAWDGGDCCATTCVGTLCGSRHGYDCRDPAHAATDEEAHPRTPELAIVRMTELQIAIRASKTPTPSRRRRATCLSSSQCQRRAVG